MEGVEVWKSIPGYEGIYEASSMGRIKTAKGKQTQSILHGTRVWKERVLKFKGNIKTGHRVTLWKNKKHQDWLVARLVAMSFYGVPANKMTVNHKDGNRRNNVVSNLEWLTIADNIRHAFLTGLIKTPRNTVLVKNDGEAFYFLSMARAGAFIGRGTGYISLALKKRRAITGINGEVYRYIPQQRGE